MTLESTLDRVAGALGGLAERDAPLGARTTYRVGGTAAIGVEPADEVQLLEVAAAVRGSGLPLLVVGRGSNMLVSDSGFAGVAIFVADAFAAVEAAGAGVVAGGGASLPVVARRSAALGLSGFEWAVGIPGSVGGAVRMNAGGHGADMAAVLVGARVVDFERGAATWRAAADLSLGYRRSNLRPTDVVVQAELRCEPGERATGEARIAEIVRWRRANQPGGQNAGSVFTNPVRGHAGELIEKAGLKGYRLGSAEVSTKHANFIQADEGGSADDVHALIQHVRRTVAGQSGVELRTEIRLIGFGPTYPPGMRGAMGG